jgi:hypothetical protein
MRFSGYAMAVCFVSGALSFVPLFIEALRQNSQGISLGLSIGGIICAIALDWKAERLKRKAAIPKGTEGAPIERGKELQKSGRVSLKKRRIRPITVVPFSLGILLVLLYWLSPTRDSTVSLVVGLTFIALSFVFYLLLGSTKQVTGPSRERGKQNAEE